MNGRHLTRLAQMAAVAATACIGLLDPCLAETVTLRFGQIPSTVRGTSSVYLHIAEQKGFFAREEIRLERITIPGGTDKMVVALEQGAVDVAQTATPYLIQAVLRGSDAVGIASETANPIYSLIVKPEITSFADLKGRLLGLSLPVDTISISMRTLLALKGLGDTDYRVKELVGTPVRFDCLQRGECDGVPLGQPDDLIALTQGYRRLGLSTEAVSAFQFQLLAVKRSWAAANREVLVRFVRAIASSFRFIGDPANRAEVIKTMVAVTGSTEDIAGQTLALYFEPDRGVMPKHAEFSIAGLAQVIAFMGDGGMLAQPLPPPERFVDPQYLKAAGAE
jgi:ABC-type nitrate/sulfonate/bicarbonate transport system substrate-binding protein